MTSIGFALAASGIAGVCDFVGGVLSRRYAVVAVTLVAQGIALAGAGAIALTTGRTPVAEGVILGLAAGGCGAASMLSFYRAMSVGVLTVASPLLATGSVVAFGIAVASGERPSPIAVCGAALALTGAVLTGLHKSGEGNYWTEALLYSVLAAFTFGCALYLLARASNETGSVVAVLAQRASSFVVVALVFGLLRPSLRFDVVGIAGATTIGLGATGALLLFGIAADTGLISIVSILASLFPIVTVLLAYALLGERLEGRQLAGVPILLAGIALVAAGR